MMEFEIEYKAETGDEAPRRETVNIPKFLSGKVTQELRRIFQDHCSTKIYEVEGEKKTVIDSNRPMDMLHQMGLVIAREVLSHKGFKVDDLSDETIIGLANEYFERVMQGIGGTKKKD